MKILVISSNLIGDTILSTCITEYFYKKYPEAKFTFVVGHTAGQIYAHFPAKEDILLVKKRKYNLHWLDIYRLCKNIKWEIVIDFRSSIISNFLSKNKKYIFKKNKSLNHINQLEKFFKTKNTSLNVHTSDYEESISNKNIDPNYKYIVIFPGGNWNPKIWPTNNFNQLMHLLLKKYIKLKFIIVGSIQEEKKYLSKITNNIVENNFINLMGESLTLTSAYMKNSNLFIGNDSGLMHLSIASKLKTISLFGPTNDRIYGHSNSNSFVIRTKESYESLSKIKLNENLSYMNSIKPTEVFNFINKNNLL